MKNADLATTIRVTGEGFTSGFDTNRRIADLLRVPVEDPVPNYCESPDLTLLALQSRCDTLVSLPTLDGRHALVFDHLDGWCVTVGDRWEDVLASALLWSLEEKKKV